MSVQSIARKYANALFDVAAKAQRSAEVGQSLTAFAQLVAGAPDLKAVLQVPTVPARQKRAVIDALLAASGEVPDEVRRLLTLLADRDRLSALQGISDAYQARVMDAARISPAQVVTAVELSPERTTALAEALGAATGRQVTIEQRVDPSIIGGVVAKVGSLVFDGSVVGQLERMRRRLSADL